MKLKPSLLLMALLGAFGTAHAGPYTTYTIDSRHTFPVFEVDHYGFTTQRGRFEKTSGKLELDTERKEGSVEVTIDATSIDMGLEEWNKHMRGERFFNVERFPTVRFVAPRFHVEFGQTGRVEGELTLLGVMRPVVLEMTRVKCAKHPVLPKEVCGANLVTTLRRSDYGMTYGVPGIGDEIRIMIAVEALKDS